jgi:hypothetical protein
MRFDRIAWDHHGERPRPGADPDEHAAEARRYLADQGCPPRLVQSKSRSANRRRARATGTSTQPGYKTPKA